MTPSTRVAPSLRFGDDQRRAAGGGDAVDDLAGLGRDLAAAARAPRSITEPAAPLRIWRAGEPSLGRSTPLIRVWARERHERGVGQLARVRARAARTPSLASTTMMRPSGVSSASEDSCAASASSASSTAPTGDELARLPVAERDGAGLVEQQRVDVAGRLDRTARHGEHVALHQPVHAGDADRGQQRADRGRDQADQQRDQHDAGDAVGVERGGVGMPGWFAFEKIASGCRVATASRKMIVSDASRMLSAISFGVFCRLAPSTSAIIRSMKLSPGFWVISTTIRSESTFVPPVTWSGRRRDSRMTGADLAGDRRLVDARRCPR